MEITPQNYKIKSSCKEHQTTLKGTTSLFPETDRPIVALDIGYSAVKGYTATSMFVFPFFAVEIDKNTSFIGKADPREILYKDTESGRLFRVGEYAERQISQDNTSYSTSRDERNRYSTEEFLICARVGIAMAFLTMPDFKGQPPMNFINDFFLQTGLPTKYLKLDTKRLVAALSGHHKFEVKIADGKMTAFDFTLPEENIHVAAQPYGTIWNFGFGTTNRYCPVNGTELYNKSILICDIGYGTLDTCEIRGRSLNAKNTYTSLGMCAVLDRLAQKITDRFEMEANPITIQKWLEDGKVTGKAYDENGDLCAVNEDITPLLTEASNEVCAEAIRTIKEKESLKEYDYVIVTGGTGSAWFNQLEEALGKGGIRVVSAASADEETNNTFANVRGYYLSRLMMENKRKA